MADKAANQRDFLLACDSARGTLRSLGRGELGRGDELLQDMDPNGLHRIIWDLEAIVTVVQRELDDRLGREPMDLG